MGRFGEGDRDGVGVGKLPPAQPPRDEAGGAGGFGTPKPWGCWRRDGPGGSQQLWGHRDSRSGHFVPVVVSPKPCLPQNLFPGPPLLPHACSQLRFYFRKVEGTPGLLPGQPWASRRGAGCRDGAAPCPPWDGWSPAGVGSRALSPPRSGPMREMLPGRARRRVLNHGRQLPKIPGDAGASCKHPRAPR